MSKETIINKVMDIHNVYTLNGKVGLLFEDKGVEGNKSVNKNVRFKPLDALNVNFLESLKECKGLLSERVTSTACDINKANRVDGFDKVEYAGLDAEEIVNIDGFWYTVENAKKLGLSNE